MGLLEALGQERYQGLPNRNRVTERSPTMDIKKVMTVAASLAAGVVMADGIVSSSVVG